LGLGDGFLPGAPPKVSRWWGLKVRKKDLIPISAWRCERCGYLESYARPAQQVSR
jgi:hypothetical protein